jgi:holo-[acyl-carrier protein] synthase
MIHGIGVDVVEISRIEDMIRKYGDHFLEKVFTPKEIEYCSSMARPGMHFAGRWAAKEAFYKALPLSCQSLAGYKSMEVINEKEPKPYIHVCDVGLKDAMEKENLNDKHVSISHEKTICIAFVVLSQ